MIEAFFSLVLVVWAVRGLDLVAGLLFWVPSLKDDPPTQAPWPRISVIFAARDEAASVADTVRALLAQDYPDFEAIAVNDRSTDGTGEALAAFSDLRLKVVTVRTLPDGWLGKTHALQEGYRASSGEWLLFTDADVRLAPGTLKMAVAATRNWALDHLTLLPELDLRSFFEAAFTAFFSIQFSMRYRPWDAMRRFSRAYAGIGAFNLVRRSAYEKAGTHERIKLDVADDMMLGKIVKRKDCRQMLMSGEGLVRVRWVSGWKGTLAALHKNAFRGLEYSVPLLVAATGSFLVLDVAPFAGLFLPGAARFLAAGSVAMIFFVYLAAKTKDRSKYFAFPAHPFMAFALIYVLWRSALAAISEGGVRWRGTFYRLDALKKGRV